MWPGERSSGVLGTFVSGDFMGALMPRGISFHFMFISMLPLSSVYSLFFVKIFLVDAPSLIKHEHICYLI